MQFIFMLTRHDATVGDAVQTLEVIKPLGIEHIGFKDVGTNRATMRQLTHAIAAMGARSYLEIVSESREARLTSAHMAVELGVDCLLGGLEVAETLAILDGSGIDYLPYIGSPQDIPTQLRGDTQAIATDCADVVARGCAGCTLLAYRAVAAAPLDLIHAARASMGQSGRLVVAGSLDSPQQLAAIAAAGADAFTVGSAAFDGSFSPRQGLLTSQLQDIVAACP